MNDLLYEQSKDVGPSQPPGEAPPLPKSQEVSHERLIGFSTRALRRRGFVALVGAAVGGIGMGMMRPGRALGTHHIGMPPNWALPPCFPSSWHQCHCCSSSGVCCEGGCTRAFKGCPSGTPCWFGCYLGSIYWCCDHNATQHHDGECICRVYSGPNTGGCWHVEGPAGTPGIPYNIY